VSLYSFFVIGTVVIDVEKRTLV